MSRHISIYLSPPISACLAARLDGRAKGRGQRSALLARICARYDEICRREMPEVSGEEMAFLRRVISAQPSGVDTARYLDAIVSDAAANGAHDAAAIDTAALIDRIRRWTYAQRVAVCDAAERPDAATPRRHT
ncbi:MAG: hypothetical protein N3A66_01150 [Planctomycetota bacterium]|nr:hypothetical protein [Planctomycetota bacterium]